MMKLKIIFCGILTAGVFLQPLAANPGPLNSQPILRVGVTPNSPPVIFYKRNQIVGLEAELAFALGKFLNREIQFIELEWKDQIPSLIGGNTDIIMSGMSITAIRELQINFSAPYLDVGQMALVRKNDAPQFTDVSNIIMTHGKVGVLKLTTGQFLVHQEFPQAKKVFFDDPESAAKALRKKKIDLFITDSPYIHWLAAQHPDTLATIPTLLSSEQLAWGIKADDGALLKSVNQFLKKWKENGKLDQIINRWLPTGM